MSDHLGELRTLVAIVEAGSLAAAARRLARSPPSITRDLASLERRAGVILVHRSTRHSHVTAAGRRLAGQARHLLGAYEEALGEAANEATTAHGVIRLTAPTTLGRDLVAPLVTAFLAAHPQILINFQLIDRNVDLIEEDFDLAVRIGFLSDSTHIARRVGEVRRVVVASPAYLQRKGEPSLPDDLQAHDIIHHGLHGPGGQWSFLGSNGNAVNVALEARFTVNQSDTAISTAIAGQGVVRVLTHQVRTELQDGRLVRLLHAYEPKPVPVSIIWPDSRRPLHRLRLMIDHLAGGLARLDAFHAPVCEAPRS